MFWAPRSLEGLLKTIFLRGGSGWLLPSIYPSSAPHADIYNTAMASTRYVNLSQQ